MDCHRHHPSTISPSPHHRPHGYSKNNAKQFPFNWLTYIQDHQGELLDQFLSLFQERTGERTREELRIFMEKGEHDEGGLRWRIVDRLREVHQERHRLNNQIRNIQTKIKALKEQPEALQDPERLEELSREKEAFRTLIKDLNNKQTLNFFTDEGLLPNYAFPEAGVTLRSILWRTNTSKEDSSGKKYETYSLSYERPSNLAIRELVPSGVFYAEGRKVKIDQIDLKLSKPENWRICRSCSYATLAAKQEGQQKACPRCGDVMWSDQGQVRQMLRLRQVMATTSDRASRFGDDSDDRNVSFFQRHLLVDFSPDYREITYRVQDKDFPFGFEYIQPHHLP